MNYKKPAIAALVVLAALGSIALPVSAAGTHYVGVSGENEAVTYDSIQNAVENASAGDTIEVGSGTYEESIEATTDNITIQRYSSETSGTVTIDASNQTYGDAFYGEHRHNYTFGSNVALTENTVTVDPNNTANADTYSSVQKAVDNSTANTTVEIVPGEYKESVNVTVDYLAFTNNAPSNGDVAINATNTTNGQAFYGNYSDNVRVGRYVTVNENVIGVGGGTIGQAVSFSLFGIPVWALAIVVGLLGYVYYEESN